MKLYTKHLDQVITLLPVVSGLLGLDGRGILQYSRGSAAGPWSARFNIQLCFLLVAFLIFLHAAALFSVCLVLLEFHLFASAACLSLKSHHTLQFCLSSYSRKLKKLFFNSWLMHKKRKSAILHKCTHQPLP